MDRRAKLYALLPLIGCCALLLAACGERQTSSPESTTAHTYTVRGEVRSLPTAEDPASSFQLRHEAVPDFVDMQGNVVGMETMTMPFPARPEQVEDLTVGDAVEMTFQVDWQGDPALKVIEIRKLPPGTELDF